MPLNQTNKLVWIANTIHSARKITFEELNSRWIEDDDISQGKPMLKRTFIKWKWAILDTFGLNIECERTAPYRYYIDNDEDLRQGNIENWLLNTYSVSNSLSGSKSVKDRIILENVPSGREYLDPIINAMKKNRFIHIVYYNYWREDEKEHYLMPLCVKLFRQRWYMVGRKWPANEDLVFCLDRIRDFRLSSHTFEYPEDFKPKEFFDGCFGVIAGGKTKPENVVLKMSPKQANYLRDLPMHESQVETERNEQFSIFELRVRPEYDFIQELLWNNEELEVLEPLWLREEMAGIIKRMWDKYQEGLEVRG